MDTNDINNAINKIDSITELGRTIQQSQPYLNDARERLLWLKNVGDSSLPDGSGMIQPAKSFVNYINTWQFSTFTYQDATSAVGVGATGCYSVSGCLPPLFADPSPVISTEAKGLFAEIYNSDASDEREKMIRAELSQLQPSLLQEFDTASTTFEQYRGNLKSQSDVCKDIRILHDHFKGELFKLRTPRSQRSLPNCNSFGSWNKMADALKKNGAESYRALLEQKTIHEKLHDDLSHVVHGGLINGQPPTELYMTKLWQDFKEHLLSTMLLIDKKYV